ncbi:hypothetical protein U2F26_12465 [Micromonospora sp. 4G57]|uniref:Serine/threonine protein kinase n=1 Tax=Micromonospora sicca TaxID=2202420 RepID=A0ABU5J8W6_9ACTN|nr:MULTISPECIES: hypothetical protein [unclassified Micromonospora]MDZ5443544.1 hypothetical protein [Micromonospora sp. 4G57]MDZ5488983.1 hypothetical protein [Micromonospora sp. 4G53]
MQPLHPEPTSRRPLWTWAGAAAGLALALTMFLNNSGPRTGAAASRPTTGIFVVSGAVVLGDGASFTRDDHGGCAGTGAHADVVDGAPVLITTTGGLAAGRLTDPRALTDGTCRLWFSVRGVPTGQDAYLVMVADREPRQYAEQELTGALVSLRID